MEEEEDGKQCNESVTSSPYSHLLSSFVLPIQDRQNSLSVRVKHRSAGWKAHLIILAGTVRALAQVAPPAASQDAAPVEADATEEDAAPAEAAQAHPDEPAPTEAAPTAAAPAAAVQPVTPVDPAQATATPAAPVPSVPGPADAQVRRPVASGVEPAVAGDPVGANPAPEYPRFRPSLRVMTGVEWSREQRFSSAGRLESEEYGFFLSQVRAQLQGKLTKRIEAEVSAELADAYDAGVVSTSDRPLYLRDAFINIRAKRYFQIRAGHFKRPLSALEHRNAGKLQVRGRGLTNDLIIEDNAWGGRGLGAQLWGKLKVLPLTWSLGAFDPLWAPSSASRPKGLDLLGRISLEPIDGLTVGLNGGLKTVDTPPYDAYDTFFGGGGDIEVESHGFYLLVDGLVAQLPLPASDLDSQTAFGVVALMSYDVELTPDFALQPALLGEYSDASTDHSDSETLRAVVGVNGIIHDTLRVMPQVEVVDWLGSPSTLSPTQSLTAYLMLSLEL